MKTTALLIYLGKVLICVIAFLAGIAAAGALLPALGLTLPQPPKGTDPSTLSAYFALSTVFLAVALSGVANGIGGGWLVRGLSLGLLTYVCMGLNTFIEASIFTTSGATGSAGAFAATLVLYLPPCLLCGLAAAVLFRPPESGDGLVARARVFTTSFGALGWLRRLVLAVFAFPAIYLAFGSLIAPFVIDYYRQGAAELVLPPMSTILPVVFLRSLLFLAACLPVLMLWRKSPAKLLLFLGAAMFVFVGAMPLFVAYWMPARLRIVHTLEIMADSFVYVAVLALLFRRPRAVPREEHAAVSS